MRRMRGWGYVRRLGDGPDEVELDDGLPCGALLVKVGRGEGELEV